MTVSKRGSVYNYHFVVNGEHIQRSTRQGNRRVAVEMEAAHRTVLTKGAAGIGGRKTAPTQKEFAPRFIVFTSSVASMAPAFVRPRRIEQLRAFTRKPGACLSPADTKDDCFWSKDLGRSLK
jgi:hypothetical protein